MCSSMPWVLTWYILTTIFCTRVEDSYQKTIYIRHYMKTFSLSHTHTHTSQKMGIDSSWGRNTARRGREGFTLALKDDRVEECLRSCGSEFQMGGIKQEKVRKPCVLHLYCWIVLLEESLKSSVKTRHFVLNFERVKCCATFCFLIQKS